MQTEVFYIKTRDVRKFKQALKLYDADMLKYFGRTHHSATMLNHYTGPNCHMIMDFDDETKADVLFFAWTINGRLPNNKKYAWGNNLGI